MSSEFFYESIPVAPSFFNVYDPASYVPLPDDWSVAITDVIDSTGVIQRGGYKEVNLVGASSIIALLNLKKTLSLPFIFGGDGAAVCIPESLVARSKQSLAGTKTMAKEVYNIDLRIGIVPVRYIREQGYDIQIARLSLSDTYAQAAFNGGGLQFAEECIKNPAISPLFDIRASDGSAEADFTGLECRWKNVPSVHGEIVTLIVQSMRSSVEQKNNSYRDVLEQIARIYGDDAQSHPVREELLTMSMREQELRGESGVRSFARGWWFRLLYWFRIRYAVLLGIMLMKRNIRTRHTDWGGYKKRLIANTDFKKFDDKLRLVLSGTPSQRETLVVFLEEQYRAGELVYGTHVAPSALVTCLIFDYQDSHIHLVDSADGGYAMAAMRLKERLAAIDRSHT